MKICDSCREKTYDNLKSPFQVYTTCDCCGKKDNCNDTPEKHMIRKDIKKEQLSRWNPTNFDNIKNYPKDSRTFWDIAKSVEEN
jgi:hypothetical protein